MTLPAVSRRALLVGAGEVAAAAAVPAVAAVTDAVTPKALCIGLGNVVVHTSADVVLPALLPGQIVHILNLGKFPITVTSHAGAVCTLPPSKGSDDDANMVTVMGGIRE